MTSLPREELGQLEGRAYTPVTPSGWAGWGGDATAERAKVEWVLRGTEGTLVKLAARHERAGTARADITLT